MPLGIMMALYALLFGLSAAAHQEFVHKFEYRWARQDVLA